jgi:hypothetical protein
LAVRGLGIAEREDRLAVRFIAPGAGGDGGFTCGFVMVVDFGAYLGCRIRG